MQQDKPKIQQKLDPIQVSSSLSPKASQLIDINQISNSELVGNESLLSSHKNQVKFETNQHRENLESQNNGEIQRQFNDFQKFEDFHQQSLVHEQEKYQQNSQSEPRKQEQKSENDERKLEINQADKQKYSKFNQNKEIIQEQIKQEKLMDVTGENSNKAFRQETVSMDSASEPQKVILVPDNQKIDQTSQLKKQSEVIPPNLIQQPSQVKIDEDKRITLPQQIRASKEEISLSPKSKKSAQNSQKSLQNVKQRQVVPSGLTLLREAEKQRIGSIFQSFRNFNRQYEQIVGYYKLIIKNVTSQLKLKVTYKSNLQNVLVQYFQNYSKVHKQFDEKVFKLTKTLKQQHRGSGNKFVNLREELKLGFQQFSQLRKSIALNNQKFDGYINNYVIKSLSQIFQDYHSQITAQQRRQISVKQEFIKQQKIFKKFLQNLDKLCKRGIEGMKTSEDIFVQLSSYIAKEKRYREFLTQYGKTLVLRRKHFVDLQIKLFQKLQKLLNEFKHQQKTVYTVAKELNFIQDYTQFVEQSSKFQNLCTITDVDYIKSSLKLQNRKQRVKFENSHFEQFLDLHFIQAFVSQSKKLLKGAIKKSFPMKKPNSEIIHTISENLIEYDRSTSDCVQKMIIKNVNASIIGEGAIEFSQVMKGVLFTQNRTIRIQLTSADRAEQLISYLNQMQAIGKN